jgi:hypothetical protein
MEKLSQLPIGDAMREIDGFKHDLRGNRTDESRAGVIRMGLAMGAELLDDLGLLTDVPVISRRIQFPNSTVPLLPLDIQARDTKIVVDRRYYLSRTGQLVILGHDRYASDLLWDFKQFVVSDRGVSAVGEAVLLAIQDKILKEEGRQIRDSLNK